MKTMIGRLIPIGCCVFAVLCSAQMFSCEGKQVGAARAKQVYGGAICGLVGSVDTSSEMPACDACGAKETGKRFTKVLDDYLWHGAASLKCENPNPPHDPCVQSSATKCSKS